ncbi:MAG: O-antigen polysaccharide polymerase Wzy family protein [Clostridia bacterium]
MNKIARQILLVITIILFGMAFFFKQLNFMFICIMLMLIHNIIYSCEKFQRRVTFFVFQITFFTFLLGKTMLSLINHKKAFPFADDVIIHIYIALFISLLFVYLGYWFVNRKFGKTDIKLKNKTENNIYSIRKISKLIFFITYIPYISTLLEKILFVQNFTYISYYAEFDSSLPFLFVKIGEMSVISFFVFLATMPTKKECRTPVVFYLLYGILALGMGQRNQSILSILMVFIYYITRHCMNPNNEIWFKKRDIVVLICAIPLGIVFLQVFSFTRVNQSIQDFSFFKMFVDFFDTQGGSVNLIGQGYIYKDIFPNQNYVLGPVITFFKNNIFTKLFFGTHIYQGHTIEMALYGNSFGQTITYLVMPENYLAGIGLGSCYIAEAYKDWGYIGICIINSLYGVILAKFTQYFGKNTLVTSIILLFVYNIIYAPRNSALSFIMAGFNFINVFTIVIIFVSAKLINNATKKRGVLNEQKEHTCHY